MEELPKVGAMGPQPYTDILGMGDPGDRKMPAIVCLQCSTRWPDADAFWAAANAADGAETAEGESREGDGAAGDGATSDAGSARS
ncbi:MAG TPA: hypothetical protein VGQ85_05390 [Candidatus Limnocylindrales bacterium]|nr:hypothetical protein [Candidatus Limnocylindrales bacterium]